MSRPVSQGQKICIHQWRAQAHGHAADVRPARSRRDLDVRRSDTSPRVANEITVIKSMTTDEFNHAPAELLLYTGSGRQGRPSMGSWVTYGLGSENENLPGFVVLISSGVQPSGGQSCWGSGFLPSVYQGCSADPKGTRSSMFPILRVWTGKPGVARSTPSGT